MFIAALCGGVAWTAEVKISPRWGRGETGFPHTPTGWEGLGGLRPPKNYFHPVGVRRSRIDGCSEALEKIEQTCYIIPAQRFAATATDSER